MGNMEGRLERISLGAHRPSIELGGRRLTGDFGGRTAFAGRDHDQQLHDGVVDLGTARLDDEDIFLSNTIGDFDACFALQKNFA